MHSGGWRDWADLARRGLAALDHEQAVDWYRREYPKVFGERPRT
ncbi:Uncharacterized protein ChrSV_5190 [Chromobacterium vaccinii]|nr:Uncharacterized protein ChrSW_5184 [Chromobacterium vaccinii]QND92645.1 Uncharacterized protein ChrSV_5190 [Chromobacterium vaccinii]